MPAARILVVEDEALIAVDLQERLGRLGFAVTGIADTGARAVQAAAEQQPDVVLMDIVLKGAMDGITAAEEIRRQWEIPVIFVTANSDGEMARRACSTGPACFLTKPFDERELRINIELALHNRERERKRLARELAAVRQELKSLQGVIPICSACKKIRDEHGKWDPLEQYITQNSRARFSHGLCPECSASFLRDVARYTPL